ncbi:MAG: translocation/assembly module TamB domain-containing protein, partial [Parahaliea sp.]
MPRAGTKRWLLGGVLALLLLPLAALLLVFWLGASEGGTRWLAGQARAALGEQFSWHQLEGRLFGRLRLAGVEIRQPGLEATLDEVVLDWAPARLLSRELKVRQLVLDGLNIRLGESPQDDAPPAPIDPGLLDLPVAVLVDELRVNGASLHSAGGAVSRLDSLALAAELREGQLQLHNLALSAPQGSVSGAGQVALKDSLPTRLGLEWSWQLADGRALGGELDLDGTPTVLRISHRGGGDLPIQVEGELRDLLGEPGWRLAIDWPRLALTAEPGTPVLAPGRLHTEGALAAYSLGLETAVDGLAPGPLAVSLSATGNAESLTLAPLSLANGPYHLVLRGPLDWREGLRAELGLQASAEHLERLNPDLPSRLQVGGNLRAAYVDEALVLDTLALNLVNRPGQLAARGRVALPAGGAAPRIDATLHWQALQWPLEDEGLKVEVKAGAAFASPAGELVLGGTPADWRATLTAELGGTQLPPGTWTLDARGDERHLSLERLRGDTLGGAITGAGEVAWTPRPNWRLTLAGEALDPGQGHPALAGQLAFAARSTGQVDPERGPVASLDIERVAGQVAGREFSLGATARLAGEQLQVERLALANGANRLSASGALSVTALALDWNLELAEPHTLLAGAQGSLRGAGHLGGSVQAPELSASLQGEKLVLDGISLESLALSLKAGLAPEAPLDVALSLRALSQGETTLLHQLGLRAEGTTEQHELVLQAQRPDQQLQTRLQGGLGSDGGSWDGEFQQLQVAGTGTGSWRLQRAARLLLSPAGASLAELCLQADSQRVNTGRVCANAGWRPDSGSAITAHINALELGEWLPDLRAQVQGVVVGSMGQDGELRGRADLNIGAGDVRLHTAGDVHHLNHGGGGVQAQIGKTGTTVALYLQPLEAGRFDANIVLPGLNRLPLAPEQPLLGRIQGDLPDLAGLQAWLPELDSVGGRLHSDLQLAGTVQAPRLLGELALADGQADIPLAGLSLRQFGLRLRGDPAQPGWLLIDGGLDSGDGHLAMAGQVEVASGATHLQLQGERVEVLNTDDGRVLLSPDLQLSWSDALLRLHGTLTVPQASLTPKLSLSPGLDSGSAAKEKGQVIAPSTDVVILGEDGVTRPATGKLPFRLDSDVRLVLGDKVRVDALGLKGRLTGAVRFTHNSGRDDPLPLADGQLAIEDGTFRAFAQDLDIQAGKLLFDGRPVSEPEVSLRAVRWIDSDPVVTVAGVDISGTLDRPQMELFSRPQVEVTEIQSYLLTGRPSTSNTKVLGIGTYVLPKLYVGYGFNLLAETSEFDALYTITPRYGIQANVGEA